MKADYPALSVISLMPESSYVRPPEPPAFVYPDSPALDVMTHFDLVHPVVATAQMPIDLALEHMKQSGVRLLLVVKENDEIAGLITAQDIQGEVPIKVVRESGQPRSRITVGMVMTPRESIQVLNLLTVRNAKVGHIVATLNRLERQHVLVVEVDEEKRHRVRGLFSMSQISKQMHRDLTSYAGAAHSLAEIVHEIG